MSSRSLAAARAKRAGENAPPVSGNRPITSIGSQAAFAQQMPPGVGYNMPPPPNNVRTARSMQNPGAPAPVKQTPQQYQQFYDKQHQQQSQNGLPFSKLSISDAIGLITLRLGRVEQWIIETDQEDGSRQFGTGDTSGIPDNHRVIDSSVLTSIINRLDSVEKNGPGSISVSTSSEEVKKLIEDVNTLTEQFKRMGDDVAKHTIELAKNTEQVFRFNRELTETKDILKSFMVKYDMFAQQTTQNFSDYELALSDLEKRLPAELDNSEENLGEQEGTQIGTSINDIDTTDGENIIMSVDLKNLIKQELSNIS
jgi:hypothetical protein